MLGDFEQVGDQPISPSVEEIRRRAVEFFERHLAERGSKLGLRLHASRITSLVRLPPAAPLRPEQSQTRPRRLRSGPIPLP
jgi:hypothetical protein